MAIVIIYAFHNIELRQSQVRDRKQKNQHFFSFVKEHNPRIEKKEITKMHTGSVFCGNKHCL